MQQCLQQLTGGSPSAYDSGQELTSVARLTNFVIVEITPIGIQNLGWKFWIVFTVFNTAFMPVIYFFYPETGRLPSGDGMTTYKKLD